MYLDIYIPENKPPYLDLNINHNLKIILNNIYEKLFIYQNLMKNIKNFFMDENNFKKIYDFKKNNVHSEINIKKENINDNIHINDSESKFKLGENRINNYDYDDKTNINPIFEKLDRKKNTSSNFSKDSNINSDTNSYINNGINQNTNSKYDIFISYPKLKKCYKLLLCRVHPDRNKKTEYGKPNIIFNSLRDDVKNKIYLKFIELFCCFLEDKTEQYINIFTEILTIHYNNIIYQTELLYKSENYRIYRENI